MCVIRVRLKPMIPGMRGRRPPLHNQIKITLELFSEAISILHLLINNLEYILAHTYVLYIAEPFYLKFKYVPEVEGYTCQD